MLSEVRVLADLKGDIVLGRHADKTYLEFESRPLKSRHTRGFRGVNECIDCIEPQRAGFNETANVETRVQTVVAVEREETAGERDTSISDRSPK